MEKMPHRSLTTSFLLLFLLLFMARPGSADLALASTFLADGTVAGPTGRIQVDRPFPILTLPSAEDGSPHSIAAFRGRKLVVHVFASW